MRKLEYHIVQDRQMKPLVILESPMGNGQEIGLDSLRELAARLVEIADQADAFGAAQRDLPQRGEADY